MEETNSKSLRRGWTTGACATAATKAAYAALLCGEFPDPVTITLPKGLTPAFALAVTRLDGGAALAGVVKDAGDDPDITHGALVCATVYLGPPGSGVTFRAGPGVGTITRPGLPLPIGEPAINPVPRRLMREAVAEVAAALGGSGDVIVEIAIEKGESLAQRTLNPRLGIVGGLSVLGTTGVVVPYSCSAWIDSLHRGVDVARALGLAHIAGSTGSTSEAAIQARHGLPDPALIEMGDFVGGLLKYLRRHPVPRLSLAGGLAKMTKLGQGRLDLHSKRGTADMEALAALAGGPPELTAAIGAANTVLEAFTLATAAGVPLGDRIAQAAWATAAEVLAGSGMELEVVVFDRTGQVVGDSGWNPVPIRG